MPEPFTIPTTRITKTTEQVVPSLSQLMLEFGTPTTPSRAHTWLRARDEAGEWDDAVQELYAVIQDDMKREVRLATLTNNLILDAVIPADDPRAVALGVGGLTVRQMGEMLVKKKLKGDV